MKKLLTSLVAVAACAVALAVPAAAEDVRVGDVYSSNILATVDGHPIPSYNIGGRTCICIEDLSAYGFTVTWDPEAKLVSAVSAPVEANYARFADTARGEGSSVIGGIYETDIRAEVNGYPIESYNLGGYTVICMEDLGNLAGSPNATYGYSKYLMRASWDAENAVIALDTLRLTPDSENPILLAGLQYACNYRATEPYGTVRIDTAYQSGFRGAIANVIPLYLETKSEMTDIVIGYACRFGVSFNLGVTSDVIAQQSYRSNDPETAAYEAAAEPGFDMLEILSGDGVFVLYGEYRYGSGSIYSLRLFLPDGRVIEVLEDLPFVDSAEPITPLDSISISPGETDLYFSLTYNGRQLDFEVELLTGDLGMRR